MHSTKLPVMVATSVDTDLVTALSIRVASEIGDAPVYHPQGSALGLYPILLEGPTPKPQG